MIELRVLGSVDLRAPDGRDLQSVLRHPKRLALLAYLAVARPRGFHRRDALLALFWPDLDQAHARNALRQAVHFLRAALGHDLLVARGKEELTLDPERLSCDVAEFEKYLDAGDPRLALNLYRGDLLAAVHVSDAVEFERWLDQEREYLRRRAVGAALALAQEEEMRGGALRAARWASRALEISPYDEGALRRLLRLLDQAGDRAEAIHEYDAFARRLALDLSLAPAPETASLAEAIRARAEPRSGASHDILLATAPGSTAPGGAELPSDVSAAGTSPRSSRLGWRLALGAAATVLVGGTVVVASSRKPTALDPELIAVAPFGILDPKLELWHEGLVDVLSRNLDGAGPFRTVSPTVVIRRWQGRADRASAEGLGRRTGAGIVLFGQLSGVGADSVRLRAAVLDARNDRTLSEIDRIDQTDRIDRLADSLSLDVIRILTATAPGIHIRLFSVGTRSLPALKAFLQGERFLRRFALDSAIASYDRAVAMDTAFALALRRLQWALGWNDSVGPVNYFTRAAAANRGLAPRDSLLLLSDSGFAGRVSVPNHPAFRSIARRRFAVLEEAARRYPEDPEVWYQVGEAGYHAGFVVGESWNGARAAFDRAIALDPGFAPAYIHPVEIALNDNDSDAALRYVRGYLSIPSVTPEGAAMRLLSKLLDPRGTPSRDLGRELETASPATLRRLAFAVVSWPDANETQIQVWRRLLVTTRARLIAGDTVPFEEPGTYAAMVPTVLIHRGHLQEARRIVGNRFDMPFMELAKLGAIPPEAVEAVLDQWFQHPSDEDVSFYPWFTAAPCSRTMDAALWWASRKGTTSLRRLAAREESDPRAKTSLVAGIASRRPVPGFVRAALALAQGDTTLALSRFLAFPDSLCPNARQLREVRFRLLVATGRNAEAAAVFDRSHDRRVPFVLERARLAERLGDRPTAVKYYQFVAQAWLHADPELQPVVVEARAAIVRLGGEPRRE